MSDTLAAFNNPKEEVDLQAFSDQSAEDLVKAKSSEDTVATQGALLSSNPAEEFMRLSGVSEAERREILGLTNKQYHESNIKAKQEAAASMLTDPAYSEEDKLEIANAMVKVSSEEQSDSLTNMKESVGLEPISGEDEESESLRIDYVAAMKRGAEDYRENQSLMNQYMHSDESLGELALDFAEVMAPYSENIFVAKVARALETGSGAQAMALLGSEKAELREMYQGMEYEDQRKFAKVLAKTISASTGITFINDNNLIEKDLFQSIVDGTYYGDGGVAIDNVINVLDATGVGMLLGRALRGANLATKASKIARKAMRAKVQPASTGKVVGEVNPEKARALHAIAENDETGEAAEIIYGTTREEAIIHAEAPQVPMPDGSVEPVPHDLARDVDIFTEDAMIDLSPEELKKAQIRQAERTQKVNGITNRSTIAPQLREDGSIVYKNVYGPADSSYKDARKGIDNVLFQLRDYGITEENVTVLRRNREGQYVPTSLKEIEGNLEVRAELKRKRQRIPEELHKKNLLDDYLIQVDFVESLEKDLTSLSKKDDGIFSPLKVTYNWLDRIPFFNKAKKGQASLQRSFMDIHSMLDPQLTLGANLAVDKGSALEAALIRHADNFVKPFRKLEGDQQVLMMEVIKDNNLNRKLMTKTQMRDKGLSDESIELMGKWKDAWDQLWHLENRDLVKSLRAGGYMKLVDDGQNIDLVARPISQDAAKNVARVYDPQKGELVNLSPEELDNIYKKGGTIANSRDTIKHKGESFDHVLVYNKQDRSYLRKIQDNERILNYTEGYYTVRYKDPHIIIRIDENGVERAVQTAGSKKEAQLAVDNLNRGNTKSRVTYSFRDNKDRSIGQLEDDYWSIQSHIGRTSQKFRGERLGTTDTALANNSLGAVEGPAEALMNSMRSISRRTSMRDYLDRYKQRFMDEYDDLIQTDPASGRKVFPNSADDFKKLESSDSKRMADARTNLEYIHYLENGYRNSLDDSYKAVVHGIADALGRVSTKAEKGVRAVVDEVSSPTSFFKARAFEAYLALNPVRQLIIQSHQASLLAANFTKYTMSGKLAKEVTAIHSAMILGDKVKDAKALQKGLGMSGDEMLALAKEYKDTGFDHAIDRNNLIENGLEHLVDTTRFKGVKAAQKAVVGTMRKVGFDAGERVNIMSAWLAHRNRALEAGEDITSTRVKADIMARARNYTYNMNAAGDMPYNKNSLALIFQFMQVPHKAMLQMTNRVLSREEKLKLAAYHAVVMPLPVGLGYGLITSLEIEDPDARDLVANGLEGFLFNKFAQATFGDDTRVDFSSLAAIDHYALLDLMEGLATGNLEEIVSSAPAMSLWMGHNPRITNILKETYNFITEPQEISPKKTLDLMKSYASYSSGYANMSKSFRELFVQEYDRRYNSLGDVSDQEITTPEMIAKAMGFGSQDEAYYRETNNHLYQYSSEAKEDVTKHYKEFKRFLASRGMNIDSEGHTEEMTRMFWAINPGTAAKKHFMSLLLKDARKQGGESEVVRRIMNAAGILPADQLEELLRGAGVYGEFEKMVENIRFLEEGE